MKLSPLGKFLLWRVRHINDNQFLMILSMLVGILVGLAAYVIKSLVHYIQSLLDKFSMEISNYLFLIYPLGGLFLTILFIKYINKQPVGHGIPSVLYAISKKNGIIKRHNLYSQLFRAV